MMTRTDEVVLFYLCYKMMTLRELAKHTGKAVSTIRESAKRLIENGYMTGKKSPKGYYLSRSYRYSEKGEKYAKQ